jgi:hypothetical protein
VSEFTLKVPPSSRLPLSWVIGEKDNQKAMDRRTIKAVFAALGFSKWMTADFEGPVSPKSIFEILDITNQGNAKKDQIVPLYLPQKLTQEVTITQIRCNRRHTRKNHEAAVLLLLRKLLKPVGG